MAGEENHDDVGTATLRRILSSPVAMQVAHERGVAQRISILQELEEEAQSSALAEIEEQDDEGDEEVESVDTYGSGADDGFGGLGMLSGVPKVSRKASVGIERMLERHERRKARVAQLDALAGSLQAAMRLRKGFKSKEGMQNLRRATTRVRLALETADKAMGKEVGGGKEDDGEEGEEQVLELSSESEEEEEEGEEDEGRVEGKRGDGVRSLGKGGKVGGGGGGEDGESGGILTVAPVKPPKFGDKREHVLLIRTNRTTPPPAVADMERVAATKMWLQTTFSGKAAAEGMVDERVQVRAMVLDATSMVGAERVLEELELGAPLALFEMPWVLVIRGTAAELKRKKRGRRLVRRAHRLGCATVVEGDTNARTLAMRLLVLLMRTKEADEAADEVEAGKTVRAPVQYRVADASDAAIGGWKTGLVGQAGVSVTGSREHRGPSLRESARRLSETLRTAVDDRVDDASQLFAKRLAHGEAKTRAYILAAASAAAQWDGSKDLKASDARARRVKALRDDIIPEKTTPRPRPRRSSTTRHRPSAPTRAPTSSVKPLAKAIVQQSMPVEMLRDLLDTSTTPAQRARESRRRKLEREAANAARKAAGIGDKDMTMDEGGDSMPTSPQPPTKSGVDDATSLAPTSLDIGRYSPRRAEAILRDRVIAPSLIDPRASVDGGRRPQSPPPPPSAEEQMEKSSKTLLFALRKLAKAAKRFLELTLDDNDDVDRSTLMKARENVLKAGKALKEAANDDSGALVADVSRIVADARRKYSPTAVRERVRRTTMAASLASASAPSSPFSALPSSPPRRKSTISDDVGTPKSTAAAAFPFPNLTGALLLEGEEDKATAKIFDDAGSIRLRLDMEIDHLLEVDSEAETERDEGNDDHWGEDLIGIHEREEDEAGDEDGSSSVSSGDSEDRRLGIGKYAPSRRSSTESEDEKDIPVRSLLDAASLVEDVGLRKRLEEVVSEFVEAEVEANLARAEYERAREARHRAARSRAKDIEAMIAEAGERAKVESKDPVAKKMKMEKERREKEKKRKEKEKEEREKRVRGSLGQSMSFSDLVSGAMSQHGGKKSVTSGEESGGRGDIPPGLLGSVPEALLQSATRDPIPATALRNSSAKALPFVRQGLGLDVNAVGADEQAVMCYSRALAADARCAVARLLRATALLRLGRAEDALLDLNAVLRARPRDRVAKYNLAVALACLGKTGEALKQLNTLLQHHDHSWSAQARRTAFMSESSSNPLRESMQHHSHSHLPHPTSHPPAHLPPVHIESKAKKTTPRTSKDLTESSIASTASVANEKPTAATSTSAPRPLPLPRGTVGASASMPALPSARMSTARGRPSARRQPSVGGESRVSSSRKRGRTPPSRWAVDPSTLRLRGLIRRRQGDYQGAYQDYSAAVYWERKVLRGECRGPEGEEKGVAAKVMREALKRHAAQARQLPSSGGGFVGAWKLDFPGVAELGDPRAESKSSRDLGGVKMKGAGGKKWKKKGKMGGSKASMRSSASRMSTASSPSSPSSSSSTIHASGSPEHEEFKPTSSTIILPGRTEPVSLFGPEARRASKIPEAAPPTLSSSISASMLAESVAPSGSHVVVDKLSTGRSSTRLEDSESIHGGTGGDGVGEESSSRRLLEDSKEFNPFRALGPAKPQRARDRWSLLAKSVESGSSFEGMSASRIGEDPSISLAGMDALTLEVGPRKAVETVPDPVVQVQAITSGRTSLFQSIVARDSELIAALDSPEGTRSGLQVATIRHALSVVPLFRQWPSPLQTELSQRFRVRRVGPGEFYQREGEDPSHFGILLEGSMDIRVAVLATLGEDEEDGERGERSVIEQQTDVTVGKLGPGDPAGDLALLFGPERALTLVGGPKGTVLVELGAREFFGLRVDEAILYRLRQRADALQRTGAFVGYAMDHLLRIACVARERAVPAGTALVSQGQVPRALFVLLKGICTVTRSPDKVAAVNAAIAEAAARLSDLNWAFPYHRTLMTDPDSTIPLPDPVKRALQRRYGLVEGSPSKTSSSSSSSTAVTTGAAARMEARREQKVDRLDARSSMGGVEGEPVTAVDLARAKLKQRLQALFATKLQLLSEEYAKRIERRKNREEAKAQRRRQRMRLRRALHRSLGDTSSSSSSSSTSTFSTAARRRASTFDVKEKSIEEWATEKVHDSDSDAEEEDDNNRVHVADLQPTQLFGEHCLLGSRGIGAPATVETSTFAEVLEIPSTLIDRSLFSPSDMQRITDHGPPNPPEAEIEAKLGGEAHMRKYASELLGRIPKHRWPVDKRRLRNLPGGKSIILDADRVPGSTLTKSEVGLEELVRTTLPPQ